MISAPLRFDARRHIYIALDTGEVTPNITRMLHRAGLVDERWFTEEGRERGREVHRLTAALDLDGLDLPTLVSPYRAYVLAHAKAMALVPHEWAHVEVPAIHPTLRFAGRCDRAGLVHQWPSVWEVKSGAKHPANQVQTALQAILAAPTFGIDPRRVKRYIEYVDRTGKFQVFEHTDPRDFDRAFRLIREAQWYDDVYTELEGFAYEASA